MPPWRKKQVSQKMRAQEKVAQTAADKMEAVMKKAVSYVIDMAATTGKFHEPDLSAMFTVGESFYKDVLHHAINDSENERKVQKGKKNLAAPRLPTSLKGLEFVFRDKRFWPRILKRNKLLVENLRKAYLKKLRRKFTELMPRILDNEINVNDAKKQMMQAWDASKSRVTTIFRTETTNYFAKTQVKYFEGDHAIIGFLFDSVRDKSRTKICTARHGLIFRPGTQLLTKNTPALHWNCRSHLIALANTPYNRRLLEDKNRDPSGKSLPPPPPGWTVGK
jgi:SPP1 gp7 family putative phage head morphogenesis protein